MNISLTKYSHSCVLIKASEKTVVFDPGAYSINSGLLENENIINLDAIILTHNHGDHLSVDLIKQLQVKSPDLSIVGNQEVVSSIRRAGISCNLVSGLDYIKSFVAEHEELPLPNIPVSNNTGYTFMDVFSHPGDSYKFRETSPILAMPFVAPFSNVGEGLNKVLELKPKYVLPIHDWFYRDEANTWLHKILKPLLDEQGITLLSPSDNEALNLDIDI